MSYTVLDHLNEILKGDFEKIKQKFKGITDLELIDKTTGWSFEAICAFTDEEGEYTQLASIEVDFIIDFNLYNFAENVIYEIKNQTPEKKYLFFKKEITWKEKDTLITYLEDEGCLSIWNDNDTLHIHELIEAIEDEELRNWLVAKED